MKPTTKRALMLVSRPIGACPKSFLDGDVGVRFGARLHELRDMGYVIGKRRCDIAGHSHRTPAVNYVLEAAPEIEGQQSLEVAS